MSKENVKLLLVKSSGKNFWQWSLLNCFTGSSTVVQTLETKHSKVIRCQYGQKLPANTASAEDFVYKDEVLDTFQ